MKKIVTNDLLVYSGGQLLQKQNNDINDLLMSTLRYQQSLKNNCKGEHSMSCNTYNVLFYDTYRTTMIINSNCP